MSAETERWIISNERSRTEHHGIVSITQMSLLPELEITIYGCARCGPKRRWYKRRSTVEKHIAMVHPHG